MADDMYGANQQESNETANNGYYEQQEQPTQATQPAQPTQAAQPAQTYSPAPEFGAYGPTNNENEAGTNTTQYPANNYAVNQNNDANNTNISNAPTQYTGSQNYYGNNNSNSFGNTYNYGTDNNSYPNNEVGNQTPAQQNFGNNASNEENENIAKTSIINTNAENKNAKNNAKNTNKKGNKRKTKSSSSTVFVAILSSAISAIVCVVVVLFAISQGLISIPQSSSLSSIGSNSSGPGTAVVKGGQAPDWQGVAKNVSGAVVSIQTRLEKGMGKGSGAIIDSKGYVVTNNHVIADAKEIQVTLSNGQIYSATLVGADKTTDLAVLKLDNSPNNLKAVQFADSNLLSVGEPVMAIGNPLGYDDTATTGIVSALNRPVSVMDDQSRSEVVTNAVQIDAAINPGNSGGPTFNAAGKVIGINSSIAATSIQGEATGSIGIGFAIPANLVKRVVTEIIKNGSVKHVALGIMIKSTAVESEGITRGGAQVVSVNQGSPAEKAGLKANDTIVAFDDKPVSNNYALLGYVRATAFNQKATITIVRNGNTLKLQITFDQEEAAVNGTNKQEKQLKKNQKKPSKKRSNSKSDDDDDLQQRGDDDGDDGGIFDPFGFW
ncbi:S1C family serine protease [Gardnerella sp. DNF00983]|uniref:S1C family serine protease n=1 Tax=Gardnerella sp. DNF00983 TaxID=2749056 RepID=UPI003BAD7A03